MIRTTKRDVEMAREMVATVANDEEIRLAGESIAESMARMFPTHSYKKHNVVLNGKLLTVVYTYQYSPWKAFCFRAKEFCCRILPASMRSSAL